MSWFWIIYAMTEINSVLDGPAKDAEAGARRVANLAASLAAAGALCEAFNQGHDFVLLPKSSMGITIAWQPGCRRPAPGMEKS